MVDARACARLLLDTIPVLMRGLHGAIRQRRLSDLADGTAPLETSNHLPGHGPGEARGQADELFTIGQFRTLEMLHHRPWTLSELAAQHQITPSTMSRAVDILVRRDWVTREVDPQDRRQVILRLTAEGQTARAAMVGQFEESLTRMVAQLDPFELEQLYQGIGVLHRLLDRTGVPATDERCGG